LLENLERSLIQYTILKLDKFRQEIDRLRQKYPQDYQNKNTRKRLAAINKLTFKIIPQDPTRQEYRQVNTICSEYKHWF
jgi:toxin YhaV